MITDEFLRELWLEAREVENRPTRTRAQRRHHAQRVKANVRRTIANAWHVVEELAQDAKLIGKLAAVHMRPRSWDGYSPPSPPRRKAMVNRDAENELWNAWKPECA